MRRSSETTRQVSSQKGYLMELLPDWVTGFVDGEGCFYVGINRHPEMTVGFQVLPEFRVVQHKNDIQILYALKRFFGFGIVCKNHDDRFEFRVRKLDSLLKICEFFNRHPLKTKKAIEFKRFQRILHWMKGKKHLTIEGLVKITETAQTMNRADSQALQQIMKELKEKTG